jgi:Flp pilus assembly protein TadB
VVVSGLALAWAVLAALPLARLAARESTRARARDLAAGTSRTPRWAGWRAPRVAQVAIAVLAAPVRRRARKRHDAAVLQELPVVIDLLAVAVGAGCTPYAALDVAATWCPPRLRVALDEVTRACSLGESFHGALRTAAQRTPALAPVTDALDAAARLGAPIAPTLARLASDTRADLRRAAEARARTVPVRLLFPLVFLVLPAFGLLTVAPVLLDGLATH